MSPDARYRTGMPEASALSAVALSEEDMRSYVVSHVDEAVDGGWVRPYYQPVIRTLTGKLCGFEALARWEDPTYGVLAPASFIGALEDTKLIYKVDCSIIRQACKHHRDCMDRGEPIVPISINLSRIDFETCDVFKVIEEATREYEVPHNMLNIEITETVLGSDPTYMASMVRRFHDVGYQVWMDDFGSGYSTLNVLKDFDFDELKIDMEFLNRFGEKSKTILASVVDMAKKLGIQTLAEGVETEEHRKYLRRIGCEKMQGFLYGRPQPYEVGSLLEWEREGGVESTSERRYFEEIGSVNTLSLSERDFSAGNSTRDYVTSMPLAIVEFDGDEFRVLDSNRVFREGLANVGIPSIDVAERLINDQSRTLARSSRKLLDTIADVKFARQDYVAGGVTCVMRIRHITSSGGKVAVLVSIDDTIGQSERKRHDRMHEALGVLYSIYEHVDIIHLDDGFTEPVFSRSGFRSVYDVPSIGDAVAQFAENEIFPADRARYRMFMDPSTMVERIQSSGERYIVDFFRTRDRGGDYAWKLFGLIRLTDVPDNQVLICIRSTHWANDGLFQEAFDGHVDDGLRPSLERADMRVSDGSLWRAISRDEAMGFFWKDRERRFLGANKRFLDYYGFDSVDEILGKTDEDMGWHIDPVPFKEDELRVLNEGASFENALGQCIARGEVRDIVATKRPVYRNGRIVGLVGYFVDARDKMLADDETGRLPFRDNVTGVLNYTGLESATWRFVDSYVKLGIDFSMISINLENYRLINESFGYEFGDKVLRRVADELLDVAGSRCAIGHVYAERFVILVQNATDEALQGMCDEIERRLTAIAHVDGTPCTVYALAGYARYSEHRDIEAMKRHNRDNRIARSDEVGSSNEGDVITSTLL